MHGPRGMVTAIQTDLEVAFRKLPSKEFFMFYFITSKSETKRHYKLYLSVMIKLLRILFLHFGCKIIYSL